jgi:hypothetical protein
MAWLVASLGVLLALYVFMADAIRVAPEGPEAVRNVLPDRFNGPLFGLAWLLMAVPVFAIVARRRGQRRSVTQDFDRRPQPACSAGIGSRPE